jgi:hypothetical protein
MTQTVDLPQGSDVALRGLELAHGRLREGVKKYVRGDGGVLVTVALTEALYWIAVTDHYGLTHVSDYAQKRASSPGGLTVGGLWYARNFGPHELISPSESAGPEMQLGWTASPKLPAPTRAEQRGHADMYDEMVAERPLSQPIAYARVWLESILRWNIRRGVTAGVGGPRPYV